MKVFIERSIQWRYTYDDIGVHAPTSVSEVGNRTTAEGKTYTANNLNQYIAIDDFTPQYDADGNQTLIKTETGIWSVVYNAENRPIRWQSGDTVVTMVFDRMGLLDDAANGPIDVLAGVTLDHSDVGAVIVDAINHDDERPMAFAARDDGVELPVPGLKPLFGRLRKVCVPMLRRMVAGGLGVDITLSTAKTSVTLLPIDHSRDEALSGVVVEGGAGRDVLAISGFFCQAMSGSGDARPLRQFGQKVGSFLV